MDYFRNLPPVFDLPENELHIWNILLLQPEAVLLKLFALLDEKEKSKAGKFKFENDKQNYIAAHGAMRQILAGYLKRRPQKVAFETNRYGKPFLAENINKIEFNLAHSKNRALLAVAKNKQVGVDIEYHRPEIGISNLAEQYFSARENEAFRNLDENLRTKAFFDCWTRKEAFIKAIGKGLFYPLNLFDVSIEPGISARLLFINGSAARAERWQMTDLDIGGAYSAAAIIKSNPVKLKLTNWKYFDNTNFTEL